MEHTHPDDLPVLAQTMEQMLANPGKPVPAIWRRRHKEGHWIWLEGVATNLLGDPSVGAIVCNYRDITGRLAHERRLGEQLQRLALLSRITRAIGERQDLRSIFQVVVRSLEDELPVDFCSICLYDAAQNQLSVSCVSLNSEPLAQRIGLMQETVVPIDENGLGRCITGHLVYEADIAASRFEFPRKLAGAGMRSLVIAPLLVESQVFGVLVCARHAAEAFTSGECEFLRQVSEHTALASHQAQLYGALQRAYDDLRQTQQQVMQQERLRALGQMASGIAHDINNAISPMSLYTESLLERETQSERSRAQATGDHPARRRRRGADGRAHGRVLPPARAARLAGAGRSEPAGRTRGGPDAGALERHGAAARRRHQTTARTGRRRCRPSPRWRARSATRW